MSRPDALLLLGPTGSGKTPLGDALADRGAPGGRAVVHFDFGRRLRAVARGDLCPPGLGPDDVLSVRRALREGVLLEDAQFPIAARILEDFLRERPPLAWVALNGLPRHLGQASDVEALVRIRTVALLEATPGVLHARIRRNVGGDRLGRADDAPERVASRVERFLQRTLPLVDHYEGLGARIQRLPVGAETCAEDLRRALGL